MVTSDGELTMIDDQLTTIDGNYDGELMAN